MQLDFVSSTSRKLLDSTISQGAVMGYSTMAVTGTEPIALVITVRRSEAVDNEKAVGGGVKSERKKLYTTILMGGVVLLFAFGFGGIFTKKPGDKSRPVSYTHLRAHETPEHLVCRLLLEKKKT
eukprot:TRINITY_DN38336_c0_g1_i3.p1 TRINITY_DN38336_c0_g1~~TRINITY_DN38336_c0_g1_i3.p1  ORF type:complete len:124 (-),score=26.77 TRINITY_DN38336_c0_g1_i3:24-395(-)